MDSTLDVSVEENGASAIRSSRMGYFARRDVEALTLQTTAASRLQRSVDERSSDRLKVGEVWGEKLRTMEVTYLRKLDEHTKHADESILHNISAIQNFHENEEENEDMTVALLSTTIEQLSTQFLGSAGALNGELGDIQNHLTSAVRDLQDEAVTQRSHYETQVDSVFSMLHDVVRKLKEEVRAEGEQRRKAEQVVMQRLSR